MNIQDLLEAEMNKLRRLNPEVHALLEKIFQYKDGKGDYSVDRHRWMETLDEETFLNEIRQIEARQKAIAMAHAQITQQIAKETLASTVLLEMEDATGRLLGIGSGFFIHSNQIVTSFHLIEGAKRGAVKLLGKSTVYNIEGITAKDEKHDLVILQVPNFGIPPLSLGNSDMVEIGETVYVAGNPKESIETFSYGIISSIRGDSTDKRFQMIAPASPWSSGIPVLNEKREVIGVSVMTVADEQNPNFIIPVNYLKILLTRTEPAKPLSQGKPLVSAETYFRWGYTKSELGQYESAIADYDIAIHLKPDYAIAYNDRGVVKGKLGEYKAAIEDYDEAIRLKPDCVVTYYNRGRTKDQLKQDSAAIEDYNIAIDLAPDYADAYYNRGVVKGKLGEYKAAIEDYDKAIDLKPDYAMAYNNRGMARSALRQHEAAIEDYNIAIDLAPGYADAYYNRGNTKSALKEYKVAIAGYDKAIDLNPDYAMAYNNRGNAKSILRQYKAAIEDYDEAIRLNSDYAMAYYNRGSAKTNLGRVSEAALDFQTALELAEQTGDERLKATISTPVEIHAE